MDDVNHYYQSHRDDMVIMMDLSDLKLTLDMLTDLVVCYGRAAQHLNFEDERSIKLAIHVMSRAGK